MSEMASVRRAACCSIVYLASPTGGIEQANRERPEQHAQQQGYQELRENGTSNRAREQEGEHDPVAPHKDHDTVAPQRVEKEENEKHPKPADYAETDGLVFSVSAALASGIMFRQLLTTRG